MNCNVPSGYVILSAKTERHCLLAKNRAVHQGGVRVSPEYRQRRARAPHCCRAPAGRTQSQRWHDARPDSAERIEERVGTAGGRGARSRATLNRKVPRQSTAHSDTPGRYFKIPFSLIYELQGDGDVACD